MQATTGSPRFALPVPGVCAAPHLPAGILSPYRDGERGAVIDDFAIAGVADQGRGRPLSPRLRGEMPGRAMRGGANIDN
ncbi:MAG: hypothetical protein E5Y83_19430 [Mesorhizobium sp.]|nr:MAG: hypothetical protein E5Y85_24110 [Mesorhizobium sp.]TIL51105.1 MAG: hypothetical protein E5Y83_19430 [Mesorhizobium sp.]